MNRIISVAFAFLLIVCFTQSFAGRTTSTSSGNWITVGTWDNGVPQNNDTVIIAAGHTVTLTTNPYNGDYLFIIVLGTLDLSNNGKLKLSASSYVVVESGGTVLGNNNADQISIGGGPAEWQGSEGNITGPAYAADGVKPIGGDGAGTLPDSYIPLPVELIKFTAKFIHGKAQLDWSTANEINNDGFFIEKSFDGVSFESIGFVQGNGSTKAQQNYSFIDHEFYNDCYYRLKQVDYDGQYEYHPIISLKRQGNGESLSLSVYPNPTFGHITIDGLTSDVESIQVSNDYGTPVWTMSSKEDAELAVDLLNDQLQNMVSGNYYITITQQGRKQTLRLIKK